MVTIAIDRLKLTLPRPETFDPDAFRLALQRELAAAWPRQGLLPNAWTLDRLDLPPLTPAAASDPDALARHLSRHILAALQPVPSASPVSHHEATPPPTSPQS